jgi:formylglycine-generating enzyme
VERYQRVSFRSRYEDGLRALMSRLSGTPDAASAARTSEAVPPTSPAISVPAVVLRRGPIDFGWVTIPAGEFLIGSDKSKDRLAYDDESSQHRLHLPEYRIARVPVTVAQFAAFMTANQGYRTTAETQGSACSWTGSKWDDVKGADWAHPRGPDSNVRDKQDHPVTCVSWYDALAFCKWAGVWLPTEAEWEKAARGDKGFVWPWGDREPNIGLCNFNMTVGDTTPVGRYPDGKSPYGLLDVAGNVWEWTSSLNKPYKYDVSDGREDLKSGGLRVLRGGSFWNVARDVRCAYRSWYFPSNRLDYFGFRVVSPGS